MHETFENLCEGNGEPTYRFPVPDHLKRNQRIEDIPDEYAVWIKPKVTGGLWYAARYGEDRWVANPGSARTLVNILLSIQEAKKQDWTDIDRLTQLLNNMGYVDGSPSILPLLGMMGETAEVVNEGTFYTNETVPIDSPQQTMRRELDRYVREFKSAGERIDAFKKRYRAMSTEDQTIEFTIFDKVSYHKELADAFYYLLAEVIQQGLTLNDLARLSYEKVIERRGQVKIGDPPR